MASSHDLYDEADKLKAKGDLEGAVAKLNELLQGEPGFALAHSALAVLQGRLGRHEEAIQHGIEVCKLEPHDAFSFTALSVTYQRAFAATGQHAYIGKAEEAMAQAHAIQGRG